MSDDGIYTKDRKPISKDDIAHLKERLSEKKKALFRPTDEAPEMRIRRVIHNRPFVPKEYVASVNGACRFEGIQSIMHWAPEILDDIRPIPYASINGMMILDKITADAWKMRASWIKGRGINKYA